MDKLNINSTPSSVKNGRGERLLVINPGSTSTKIAVYENETPLLVRNIRPVSYTHLTLPTILLV